MLKLFSISMSWIEMNEIIPDNITQKLSNYFNLFELVREIFVTENYKSNGFDNRM